MEHTELFVIAASLLKMTGGLKSQKKTHDNIKQILITTEELISNPEICNNIAEDIENFFILLFKCRESIPIIRIIQKSVRHLVSQDVSDVINQVVLKNDIPSWPRLLALPYIVFRFNGNKQNGQNIIRTNLAEFHAAPDISKFLSELLNTIDLLLFIGQLNAY